MRFRPIGLLLSGVVVASSACSIDATAPSSLPSPRGPATALGDPDAKLGVSSVSDRFAGAGATTYTVTIDPRRKNLLNFGPHSLEIPARAVCSADSGYGLPTFDSSCESETSPVTITAVVRSTADGMPRIDLMPVMRFDPQRDVVLSLYVPTLTRESPIARIIYCATQTTELCVDEAALDPSLETHANYEEQTLFRRIKHFSGYFVES